ncbi:MAG: fatty acyl-AMP ligase [Planctomycetes bacterium]|nr:fatty acyl-AMP ligase [Planctomycetota bacterium]
MLSTDAILRDMQRRFGETDLFVDLNWICLESISDELADDWQYYAAVDDTPAFLQYTSGSTSKPKGVVVTHSNILANQRMITVCSGRDHQSLAVGWLPLFHDMGLIANTINPLYLGSGCVFMSHRQFLMRPFCWLDAISRYRAHTSGAPNFAYDYCTDKITPEELEQLDLTSWKVAYVGAEPVRMDTLERFAEKFKACGFDFNAFFPCYGLAEATLFVTGGPKSKPPKALRLSAPALEQDRVIEHNNGQPQKARSIMSCGASWLDQRIAIVNPETCVECSENEVGEIWVSGPHVAAGYWNKAEATEETFKARIVGDEETTYLRTGDLGFLRDGELFVSGRHKDLIIIRGRNLYPQDIEHTAQQAHPHFEPNGSTAFSVEVEGLEHLVIVQEVQRAYRNTIKTQEAIDAIRLAVTLEHDVQAYDVVLCNVGTVPKASSGKLQRGACRETYVNELLNTLASTVPRADAIA